MCSWMEFYPKDIKERRKDWQPKIIVQEDNFVTDALHIIIIIINT